MSENLTPFEKAAREGKIASLPRGRMPVPKAAEVPDLPIATPAVANPHIAPKVRVNLDEEGQVRPEDQLKLQQQMEYVNAAVNPDPAPSVTPPVQPAPQAETEPQPDQEQFCPNCGCNVKVDPVEVSEDDKRLFLYALLGQKPFLKTYDLFDGHIKVTFRTRTERINRLCSDQCLREIKDGRLPTNDLNLATNMYAHRLKRLHLTCSLATMSSESSLEYPSLDSAEAQERWKPLTEYVPTKGPASANATQSQVVDNSVAVACDQIFGDWSDGLYAVVFQTFGRFEQLVLRLMENAANENFWKGIGGPA